MAEVLALFFLETFFRHCFLLAKDGQLRPKTFWRGFKTLWGRNGLVRGFHPQIWSFFERDFHPWQHNNTPLVEASLAQLRSDGFAAA